MGTARMSPVYLARSNDACYNPIDVEMYTSDYKKVCGLLFTEFVFIKVEYHRHESVICAKP